MITSENIKRIPKISDLLFGILLIISVSCANKDDGDDGVTTQEIPKTIEFESHQVVTNILNYTIQGDSDLLISKIDYFSDNSCSTNIGTSDLATLKTGLIIPVQTINGSNSIYFKAYTGDALVVDCTFVTDFVHDNISPLTNPGLPSEIISLNGTSIQGNIQSVSIDESFFINDFSRIRIYSDLIGTLLLADLSSEAGNINLVSNSINSFYYSFVDDAQNESAIYSSAVTMTSDTNPPSVPTIASATSLFTANSSINIQGTVDGDTDSIIISLNGTETTITVAELNSGYGLAIGLNEVSIISIFALDEVGNRSGNFSITATHDNIAPVQPTLSTQTQTLISRSLSGANFLLQLENSDSSVINIYDDNVKTNLLYTNSIGSFVVGESIGLSISNGTNSFFIEGQDEVGNLSPLLRTDVTADNTIPSFPALNGSSLSLDNSITNLPSVTISGTLDLDVEQVEVSHNLISTTYTRTEFLSGITVTLLTNQINILYLSSIDQALNESTQTSISLEHDNIAPVLVLNFPSSNTLTTDATIKGVCEDGLSINLTSPEIDTITCSLGVFSKTLGSFVEGDTFNLTLSQTDLAGNTTTLDRSITVDTTAPILDYNPVMIPVITNNPNHIFLGNCEAGLDVYIDTSITEVVPCNLGSYVYSFNINSDTVQNVDIYQTDLAGNESRVTFSLEFDFTPPDKPELSSSLIFLNRTAIVDLDIDIMGIQSESLDIEVWESIGGTLIRTIPYASFLVGDSYTLKLNQINKIYLRSKDSAQNYSDYTEIDVYQKDLIAPVYRVITPLIFKNEYVASGVSFSDKVVIQNDTSDADTGYAVVISSMTATSNSSEITVDPTSDCLSRVVGGHETCDLVYNFNYLTNGIKDDNITFTFPDVVTQNMRIYRDEVITLTDSSTGIISSATTRTSYNKPSIYSQLNTSSIHGFNLPLNASVNVINYCTTDGYFGNVDSSTELFRVFTRVDVINPIITTSANVTDFDSTKFYCQEDDTHVYFSQPDLLYILDKSDHSLVTFKVGDTNALGIENFTTLELFQHAEVGGKLFFMSNDIDNSESHVFHFDSNTNILVIDETIPLQVVDLVEGVIQNSRFIVRYKDASSFNHLREFVWDGLTLTSNEILTNYEETVLSKSGNIDYAIRNLNLGFGDIKFFTDSTPDTLYYYDNIGSFAAIAVSFDQISKIGEDNDNYYLLKEESGVMSVVSVTRSTKLLSETILTSSPGFMSSSYQDGYLIQSSGAELSIINVADDTLETTIIGNYDLVLTPSRLLVVYRNASSHIDYWSPKFNMFFRYKSSITTSYSGTYLGIFHYLGRVYFDTYNTSSPYQVDIKAIPIMIPGDI